MEAAVPWYWDYKYLETDDHHATDTSRKYTDDGYITSVFGQHKYYHCRECGRGFVTMNDANSCCGEVRREKRYLQRQTCRQRFSIMLDSVAA